MNSFEFLVFAAACALILIILSTVLIMRYLSYRKIQESQIKEIEGERKLYNNIYDGKSEIYIVLNAADKIPSYVSIGSQNLMGIKKSDIMSDIYALRWGVPAKDVNAFNEEYAKWDKKETFKREFEFVHMESGSKRVGKVSISYNAREDVLYILIRDITEDAEERGNIRVELEQIKNLNKYRNEFISSISHEIRTPITSIQGQLKLAGMNAGNPIEVKRYTESVAEQTKKLLAILNDMFDITKMESGNIVLEKAEFDIKAVAKKLTDTYSDATAANGVSFELTSGDFNARYFMGDELRLQQVLIAFIEHAQDVTPKGGRVSVNIRQMNRGSDSANILFHIKDTGSKLTQQEAFEILGAGSGGNIALAVADQLIKIMGGQVMFNSNSDGNDFSIFLTLPLADRVQDLDAPIDISDAIINKEFTFEGCRILMAEDNETNAEIAKEILEMMGAEVDIAENGQVAVEKFMKGGQNRYHAILMDIQMPVMDGHAAAKRIRSLFGQEARTIPIIALSANAFVEDKNRSLEAGMNAHLAKPIDFDELKNELAKYL